MDFRSWFRLIFKLRGSVIPAILPQVLLCSGFGCLISYLHRQGWNLSYPLLGNVVPSIVVGLLLVFRTNTAYDRFWEGRKLWGSMVNATRNLSRQIWFGVEAQSPDSQAEKAAILRLLAAFVVATKLHLRQQPPNQELEPLIAPHLLTELETASHPPLRLVVWVEDYLQTQHRLGKLPVVQLIHLDELLEKLVEAVGGCERILKTPIPLAYAIHLKQLLLLYCLLLPFGIVDQTNWWTGLIVGLIAFTLFGVEAIGIEIENPFGCDLNDLPLNAICLTIQRNIEDLIAGTPAPSSFNPTAEISLVPSER
jgi:putative membrane protein